MRLIPPTLLLALVSSGSAAAWVNLGKSADDGFDYYVDPVTIRRSGDMAKMSLLYNYQSPQAVYNQRYLSSKLQFEYHCKDERERQLNFTVFSGNMGSGSIVYTENYTMDWKPVSPGSAGERLSKYACRKR